MENKKEVKVKRKGREGKDEAEESQGKETGAVGKWASRENINIFVKRKNRQKDQKSFEGNSR